MSVSRRIARVAIWLAMVVIGVALVFDVLYYVRGSLEMIPTQEDHGKVRLVTGFIGIVLAFVEIVLWLLLRRLERTDASPVRGGVA